ncbi:UNVERIFIED_CONTAM: hypothetical protein K2H54_048227 [Gekko kuhli]
MILRHLYPAPFYTQWAPQYLSVIRGLHGTTPLRWGHFNVESTQEIYLLTQGPRRESLFNVGPRIWQPDFGTKRSWWAHASQAWITDRLKEHKEILLTEEEEEEVEQRLGALERTQEKFHRDLEEVIRVILGMVVRALQAERDTQQALVTSYAS